jgi:PIN domain nuclease of toxin-antitoxin system
LTARRIVLDASALLAWVRNERGAETVGRLMSVAVMPAPNLTEVLHRSRARGHRMSPEELHDHVAAMGLEVESFEQADTVRAAELLLYSAEHPGPNDERLSLGDASCIAVAERLRLPLSGDDSYWSLLPLTVAFHPFRGS